MSTLAKLLVVLLLGLVPAWSGVGANAATLPAEHARAVPSRAEWLADVRAAMKGSGDYVRERVASAAEGERLAVNFDIDNTVLATYYDGGGPIRRMLRFARVLEANGVAAVFNTGRLRTLRAATRAQLRKAGYQVEMLCMRRKGEALPHGKQRCRDRFIAHGWTLIANVGNRRTDFEGTGYERAFRLPNYGEALG